MRRNNYGWGKFVEQFSHMIENWEREKEILLWRIGRIIQAETIPLVPVDTSRLVDSFEVSVQIGGSEDYVQYATNVEYALYVNDGHVQHKRFLPIKYISASGKKALVSAYGAKYKGKKGGIRGIMLSEKYIAGKYFIEKGMDKAKPRIERLVEDFMRTMFIKYGLEP